MRAGKPNAPELNFSMFIVGLGAAVPETCYRQVDCWEAIQKCPQFSQFTGRSRAILKKVLLGDNGIATRHLALDPLTDAFQLTPDALHARFVRHAPDLATRAAIAALANARLTPRDIDALVISTCTGYLCPGLTSYVAERLGLRPNALMLDLVGQGCGAAIPNLRAAESLIAAERSKNVLSICVEVCSAAFYLDDDPGVLVSACLFSDGAAAAVLSPEPAATGRSVRWQTSSSSFSAADRDLLRFEQRGGMLRNVLSLAVPKLAAAHAENVLDQTLNASGVSRAEIKTWILHAGGRDVLASLKTRLGLTADDVRFSAGILEHYGNLSSPFVYFVLKQALRENAPGGLWWMATFGAGFSSHGAILEVT
jgi:alkylresorcinol/alkylpyrone synthase